MQVVPTTPSDKVITRRVWMAGAVGTTTALACGVVGRSDDGDIRPWIDAHSHIWTRDVEHFPLAVGTRLEDLSPPSFTAEELLDITGANDVGRVVLIQHHPFHGWDNSYVLDAARRFPQVFRVVGMVDPFAPNPGKKMSDLLALGVTGFRINPGTQGKPWLAGGMEEMWATAAQTGQNMCCLINPADLPDVDRMCGKHLETPVVIDHFARIGMDGVIRQSDLDALSRLARYPRTYVKVSAFYALGKKQPPYTDLVPMIRRLVDAFGVERLMWASDSPYQLQGNHTYTASIDLVRHGLDFLSDGDRDWLLRKTAEKVFFSASP